MNKNNSKYGISKEAIKNAALGDFDDFKPEQKKDQDIISSSDNARQNSENSNGADVVFEDVNPKVSFCSNCGAEVPLGANICSTCLASSPDILNQHIGIDTGTPQKVKMADKRGGDDEQATKLVVGNNFDMIRKQIEPEIPDSGKGFGIASMVLGIVSIVFVCFAYVGIPLAVISAALGGVGLSKGLKANEKNATAIAGLACSVISLGINIAVLACVGSLLQMFFGLFA